MEKRRAEIMAPVGSFPSLTAAIKAGCDSIYFGAAQLNMRARSSHNFSIEEIKEVAEICHKAGVKCYLTMNTLLYEHDLMMMRKIIDAAKEAKVDAAIIQDIAALQYAREVGLAVHASTQLSISNFDSVKFYAQYADIVVLAREVDMRMMKSICDKIVAEDVRGPAGELVRVEVFVHGALCIAQSGRCQMSLLQNNTSAQRGACLQECRRKYKVIDEETGKEMNIRNGYVMSPKDLCCLPFLDELIATGVSVLKIEGRGRSPQYVDTVVRIYREAAEAVAEGTFNEEKVTGWMEKLKTVYNRGFTPGYYLGKNLPDWTEAAGSKATEERIFAGLVEHYFPKAEVMELKVQAHEISKGDRLVIMGKTTGVVYADASEIMKDEKFIEVSERQDMITIPAPERVRKGDKVYILKSRA